MGIAFESKLLHIPEPYELNGSSIKLPYVLIGDEAFPLKNYLMKPYPKEILSLEERIYTSGLQAGEWQSNALDYQGLKLLQKQLDSNNYTCDAKALRESKSTEGIILRLL